MLKLETENRVHKHGLLLYSLKFCCCMNLSFHLCFYSKYEGIAFHYDLIAQTFARLNYCICVMQIPITNNNNITPTVIPAFPIAMLLLMYT